MATISWVSLVTLWTPAYWLIRVRYYTLAYRLSVFQELLSRGDSETPWNFREFAHPLWPFGQLHTLWDMLWQKLEIIVDQEPGNTWLKLKLCHLEVKKKKWECHIVIVSSCIQGAMRFGVRQLRLKVLTLFSLCKIWQISLCWRPQYSHLCNGSRLHLLHRVF